MCLRHEEPSATRMTSSCHSSRIAATRRPLISPPAFVQLQQMLPAPLPPSFSLLLARIVARPEQRLMPGQPVAEAVAAVAAAGAADDALPGGAFEPAPQGRAVGRVAVDGPAFQDRLLAELLRGPRQD